MTLEKKVLENVVSMSQLKREIFQLKGRWPTVEKLNE